MKKLLAIILCVAMLMGIGTISVAAGEADDIRLLNGTAYYADYFFGGFNAQYVQNFVCGALVNEEDETFDRENWTQTYAAPAVDEFMADYFVFTDDMLSEVRELLGYDADRDVYVLPFIGGFGGFINTREYVSYDKNADGSYTLYYQTIEWLDLPQSEYDKLEGLDVWPPEVEYEGKIYELGPEGYLCKAAYKDYGLAHTLEVNDGMARFISTESYTGNKVKIGWTLESGKWAFYEYGMKQTNKWMKDSKGWVYLGEDGYMLTNSWAKDSVGWCYVGADGYAVTNKWQEDSHGWCYLNASGRMATNQWIKDSVGWCYVGADGYCVTNTWQKDSHGWCYLNASGRMAKNQWIKDSVGWCYVGADGYCVTNAWQKDSRGWCYLNASGRMVTNGFVRDSKGLCYLDANGYWDGKYR